MLDKIKVTLQYYLFPKLWLTELAGWIAKCQGGFFTRAIITLFIRWYRINMQEVQEQKLVNYKTFNDFFVRTLRHEARSINADPSTLVCPADGIISQYGMIEDGRIFQAKGHQYTLEALMACNQPMLNKFQNGSFVITYISPSDYHRVHMPCNALLREMLYVPGTLFSLNPLMSANVPNLFARNERLICFFDTEFSFMVQILIGATIVGSIETVWGGTITPPRQGILKHWNYPQAGERGAIILLKGEEMGRFKLGSTVINLFEGKSVILEKNLHLNCVSRVGQPLARGIKKNNIPLM
ncbi:phosphatidylserine decarboxylase precursor [secondary endosymbiont of Heteropsylla cubana]|uniref:Phosphatidylserine decarboxylase proenzyme n=1 Tax=secondary endosymbiont of Heteropsylla cubana TaxID=134287 RepID=J3VTV2_9ENTR|nr:archaetidylserine decarboxylase [secondary endosymbiont of Heteropsylla cubana]AFP85456.1 phosphatidylserine decarboxylase precursor [secondary endosymbiont of Heteropsylla cubana]